MRWMVINTDYAEFLAWLYRCEKGLAAASYAVQYERRIATLFGTADFYSTSLQELGHDTLEVCINNEPMQRAWCREHGIRLSASKLQGWRLRGGVLPWRHFQSRTDWMREALVAQFKHYKPDVVLNLDMGIPPDWLGALQSPSTMLVGQHAATRLPYGVDWRVYDLVLSSFPPTVEWFRRRGVRSELCRLAFEPRVRSRLAPTRRAIPVSFVGSVLPIHSTRLQLLEYLCDAFPEFEFWGPSADQVPPDSPLRDRYRGAAWGLEMYQVLHDSMITINEHGAVLPYANNYRLYEATGVECCLLTDWKPDLADIFCPGQEVVSYQTPTECAGAIEGLLSDALRRREIAVRGCMRTFADHTFRQRVEDMLSMTAAIRHLGE